MFSYIRTSKLSKSLLSFLILVFINSSVDAPDILSKSIAYNEQESILELIIEKGFGFEDAIGEQNQDKELPEKSFSKKMPLQVKASELQLENDSDKLVEILLVSNYITSIHDKTYFKVVILPPEFSG